MVVQVLPTAIQTLWCAQLAHTFTQHKDSRPLRTRQHTKKTEMWLIIMKKINWPPSDCMKRWTRSWAGSCATEIFFRYFLLLYDYQDPQKALTSVQTLWKSTLLNLNSLICARNSHTLFRIILLRLETVWKGDCILRHIYRNKIISLTA